ncbi:MAG: hypothetical protein ACQKBV_12410 [Puniceicoccales bacterium]
MKTTRINKARKGFSTIELMVAVGVMLAMGYILVPGMTKAKSATNRAKCIENHRAVQVAVRSHAAAYELNVGDSLEIGEIAGPGLWLESEPVCPEGGSYSFASQVPAIGELYLTCSLDESHEHTPASFEGW